MAYVYLPTIHEARTRQIAPATWGDAIRDNFEYVYTERPHCRVYNNVAQTISHNDTAAILTFNATIYDVGNCHDTSTNPDRLTAPRSGFYYIFAHINWALSANGRRLLDIYADNTEEFICRNESAPAANGGCSQNVSAFRYMVAGEYVRIRVFQSSGGSLSINASNSSPSHHNCSAGMAWVGE